MGEKRTTSDRREENIAIKSQAADKRAREIDFGNTSPGKNVRPRRTMKPLRIFNGTTMKLLFSITTFDDKIIKNRNGSYYRKVKDYIQPERKNRKVGRGRSGSEAAIKLIAN